MKFKNLTCTLPPCLMFITLYSTTSISGHEHMQKTKSKDVRDMSDADLERLLDQWELNDDPLELDELPEHLRPQPKIDMSQIKFSNPDDILRMSKKGKSLMMFVNVKDELTEPDADRILRIWQSSLQNNHIIAERYPIEPKRAIFMFREGSQAIDAKNFLVDQIECLSVTLEGQTFNGLHTNDVNENTTVKSGIKNNIEKLKTIRNTEL